MELGKSETWKNLNGALNAEARVCFLYRTYADKAREEGRDDVAEAFETALRNEEAHGRAWFGLLHPNAPGSAANLRDAAAGERMEWSGMYAGYADTARREGFDNIGRMFQLTAEVERSHETLFDTLLGKMQAGTDFHADGGAAWICQNCGHRQEGTDAPEFCPLCARPRGYFRQKNG